MEGPQRDEETALTGSPPDTDQPGQGAAEAEVETPLRRLSRGRRAVRGIGKWLVLALVVEYVLVPQLAGTRNSWHLLQGVDFAWLLLAAALEAASLAVYAALTRAVLPRSERPTYA